MSVNFRKQVIQEMRRRGWSAYRLGKESGVPIRAVQRYVSGQNETTTDRLALLCVALGLELRPVKGGK